MVKPRRASKRKIMDLSSPTLKKLGAPKRMKIVKKLRKSKGTSRKSVRDKNLSLNLINRFVEEKLKKIVLKLLGDETIEEIDRFVEEWEYFQDIDLIILGSSDDEYKEYTDLLREEYNTMDLENYHSMRSKEDSSDATQSINIPKTETITTQFSNRTYEEVSEVSNSHDDDCVIVDVTPSSIICLDDGDNEMNLTMSNPDNNKNNTISTENRINDVHNPSLDTISVGDSILDNDHDDFNPLFVIDSKPGFNGSKVPLYHSITSCAQSTPLRNAGDITPKNTVDLDYDLVNKAVTVIPQTLKKHRCDSDVILIQDDVQSIISLTRNDSTVDESVIYCGVQMVRTPIRRIESTTPSPNKKRVLSPVKRNRLGHIINSNKAKKNQSGFNGNTINETFQNSFKSPSACDKRIVIIDGCNVAFGHGNNKKFSAEGIEIALKYFERKGHETKIVVPQFRLRNQQSSNQALMLRLQDTDKLVVTPSKNLPGKKSSSYDDRFILQLADEFDAAIISNDNYRDLLLENPAWKTIIETRVIGYTWLKDFFMVPTDPYGKLGPKLDQILSKKV